MKKNNTTRKQLFVVIKKTRSFAKKTEITTHSRQNTATANGTASSYPNAPSAGLDNIRLPAPQAGLSGAPVPAASQPTPPAAPPAATVPPLPKFNKPHAEAAAAPSAPPAQPSTASAPQPSLPSPAPAPASVAAASTAEPEATQEPTTPPFAPDFAAVGNQLNKLMSGMAAPLSRLAGTVPGLLSSASKSIAQAAKDKPSVATSKPTPVESKATVPTVNTAEAKPIEVKPIEVDVKVDTVAPVSPSTASTLSSVPVSGRSAATASKPIATVTWNPATTISSLQRNAKDVSQKYCARAVVNAIQAGGTKIERTPAAKDLGTKLIAAGFKSIFSMPRPSSEYDRSNLLPGDVVVLEGFNKDERKGIKKDHTFGHAAMYDGSKWISDFHQPGFYPGEDYRKALPGYTIYRMVATQAQINAINASQRGESAPQTPVAMPSVPATRPAQPSVPVSRPAPQAVRPSALASRPAPQAVQPSVPASRPAPQVVQPSVPASRPAPQAVRPSVPASRPAIAESLPTASGGSNSQSEPTESVSAQGNSRQIPTVLKGKVTYDAEGREERGQYFSRQIHYPESKDPSVAAKTGVTIGRGYDMGERTQAQVYNDLIAAGIPASQASRISAAAGKKGINAKIFVNNNKDIGEITTEQQIKLFNNIYPAYESRAQLRYKEKTKGMRNVTKWEDLNPAIRDILVDIVYQGFQGKQAMPAASQNNIDQFITFLNNNEEYQRYEKGRHRVAYLQKEKNRINRN
ncbi:pesticin C-terminus-like muramidase [Dickeya fangzhongdai]|uniref:pesticin C-terminus-like muramidase n=1 Tax=Dickeya fangzhongdai TaxID=1778540 RepID=UPI000FC9DCDB|nr:pesticin C-terminus-like muramidase [Dickeya fangzhongdai]